MNIILDISCLAAAFAGVGRYTLRLAQELERHPEVASLDYFSQLSFLTRLPSAGPTTQWMSLRQHLKILPGAQQIYDLIKNRRFRELQPKAATLYHQPNFLLMPFAGPCVATIHDLSFINYPQFHPRERIRRFERLLPKTLEQGNHFITDSEFIRGEIIKQLGVSPDKITAIHLGVDDAFLVRPRAQCMQILQRYRLETFSFLLAVGTREPRKNMVGLMRAYLRLPDGTRSRHPLVVVGSPGWHQEKLPAGCAQLVGRGQIIFLGFVPAAHLPYIYSAAHAFIYPSFYEGFGLPPLEAMASGIPTLVSNRAALPEVTGGHAAIFDPDDDSGFDEALSSLLLDEALRENLRADGLSWAKSFSWQRTANATVDVYRTLLV